MSTQTVSPPEATEATETGSASFWTASRLVAEREISSQIRSKGYWITFGMFILGILAMGILPSLFGGGAPSVATVGAESERVVAETELEAQPVADAQEAEALVREGDVDAAVVPDTDGESPLDVRVIGLEDTPEDVVAALSVAPPVDLLEPSDVSSGAQYLVTFVFALFFFVFAMYGMPLAQSVVTEKQTRIVEILVSTVPIRSLLAGKIAGHSLLVFAQVAILAMIAPLALRMGDQGALLAMLAPALGWFVPFFILGFILLATMWSVAGSIVSRQEDLGSSTTLVMMLVMLPYFGVTFLQDNDLAMTILSYVPFSAAVAMPVRLFSEDARTWEPFAAMALLAVAVVVCVLVASRLYSGSLLQTGTRVKLTQAWSQAE
ncbi:ABC transporter permease [Actinobacteria bacterium YIM 96077]|uniref:ABC transporter permease n=1 Tax=Phytoactinopolyspora halophila TaxID=1981511 RepID=A0A329QL85_9ACTN|nr:ABC transporter permease [Phytoactinopolyspora halophila]AYY14830.1 ABC transporter permease [Actinobacteria bacterium YIM 96077]RAW13104.1 ABC transporter permease [Phytoactinopolyspora halophila]